MHNYFIDTYRQELMTCIRQAIAEDIGEGDHTSKAIFPIGHYAKAKLIAKQQGILAGVAFCELVLALHAPDVKLQAFFHDGDSFSQNNTLLTLEGDVQSMLSLERILLNVLQRMSGIATITHQLQQLISHTSCKVLDTRKTTPNFRIAEKWAVLIGGGVNHRMGLYDAIMLKDNHIDFCGGIDAALNQTKAYIRKLANPIPVIVEARTLSEVEICLNHPWITRVLLDNMTPDLLREAVLLINGQIPTEASGNISPDNIVSYAETGVDFVSLGYITHSAPIVDVSLRAF